MIDIFVDSNFKLTVGNVFEHLDMIDSFALAKLNGVRPVLSEALQLAPFFSRRMTMSSLDEHTARCNGVFPIMSC